MTASANPDPGNKPTLEGVTAGLERERLFRIIEDLVLWENTTNEKVLQAARDEIWRSWRRTCAQNADHPRAKELFDPEKLPADGRSRAELSVLVTDINDNPSDSVDVEYLISRNSLRRIFMAF